MFFVDSGAGQSLCSVGTAFSDLRPCRVEVTGVAGSLPIFGCETASFVVHDHDDRALIMVSFQTVFMVAVSSTYSVSLN